MVMMSSVMAVCSFCWRGRGGAASGASVAPPPRPRPGRPGSAAASRARRTGVDRPPAARGAQAPGDRGVCLAAAVGGPGDPGASRLRLRGVAARPRRGRAVLLGAVLLAALRAAQPLDDQERRLVAWRAALLCARSRRAAAASCGEADRQSGHGPIGRPEPAQDKRGKAQRMRKAIRGVVPQGPGQSIRLEEPRSVRRDTSSRSASASWVTARGARSDPERLVGFLARSPRSAAPCPLGGLGPAGGRAPWARSPSPATAPAAGGRPRVTRIVASSRCDVRWPMYSRAWRSVGWRPVVSTWCW